MAPIPRPAIERFLAKVNKGGPVPEHRPDLGPCWLWTGAKNKAGRGGFCVTTGQTHGRFVYAYVWSYEHFRGPIPPGLQPDHLCRNTACVHPWHLEVVTPRENTLRGIGPAAVNARKTHCPQGHPYTGRNLLRSNGKRVCRTCNREKQRRYREQKSHH